MKQILLFVLLLSFTSFAQQWQTIPHEHYNILKYTSGGGVGTPSANYSQFEINPNDGSMWFISNHTDSNFNIKCINSNGELTLFTPSNMPYMDMNSRSFYGIGFSSNKTFLLHRFDGAFSYDGFNWTYEETFDQGTTVCSDGDTLYFGRENESFVRFTETGATYNASNCQRLSVKNGIAWRSSTFDIGIQKLHPSLSSFTYYSPDTCNLLDWSNYDFKFARNSDTLYVAGDQGFSLAYGDVFVDTITMNTAPNMPYPTIIEFEFDSQDNIWAVFGNGFGLGAQSLIPLYIGYYDRSVQDWTLVYDQGNCPVDFTERLDIEIDPDDNLWVCDNVDLHILKINTNPGWLSLVEEKNELFSVFPNPSNGVISIQTDANVSDIEIHDLTGRLIRTMPYYPEILIEESGVYVIRLLDGASIVGNKKVVVQ